VNGHVLARNDFETLHSLASCKYVEKVRQQRVVGDQISGLRGMWRVYWRLPIQDAHVFCQNRK
jgi:hypothetical protein